MNSFFSSFLDLIFPHTCAISGEKLAHDHPIPINYNQEALLTNAENNGLINSDMEKKFKGLFPYKHLLASFIFSEGGVCQQLVHLAKYKNQPHIFTHYSQVFANELKTNAIDFSPDIIVPVPNHWFKRIKKGYNQAELLSNGIAQVLKIKHEHKVLKKLLDISSQTKNNKLDRLKRLSNLYKINQPEKIKGKHVLLVDDVITSGATIETCVNHLKKAGASHVSIYCFAVVQ